MKVHRVCFSVTTDVLCQHNYKIAVAFREVTTVLLSVIEDGGTYGIVVITFFEKGDKACYYYLQAFPIVRSTLRVFEHVDKRG